MISLHFALLVLMNAMPLESSKDIEKHINVIGNRRDFFQLSTDELVTFMELQLRFCPNYELCWLRVPKNTTETSSYRVPGVYPMCSPCACDDTCLHRGGCCPDFGLSQFMTGVYANETEYLEYIGGLSEKVNITARGQILEFNEDCVPERIKTTNRNVFPDKTRTKSYVMVTSCPKYALPRLIADCSREVNVTDGNFSWLPVFSSQTNIVYKNRYCMACNEHGINYHPFNLRLRCIVSTVYTPPNSTPVTILEWLSTTNWHCYPFVSPPKAFASFARACKAADTNTCPNSSGTYTENSLNELCNNINLPISFAHQKDRVVLNVFKNAACIFCNFAQYPIYKAQGLFDVDLDRTYYVLELNTFDDKNPQRLRISSPPSTMCSDNWTIANKNGTCVRVYCPRFMYLYKGECVPVITWMDNVYMKTMLSVTFQPYHGELLRPTSLYKTLSLTMANMAGDIFHDYTYGIWMDDRNINETVCVLFLHFKLEEGSTYATYIQRLLYFVDKLNNTYVDSGDPRGSIRAEISDQYSYGFEAIVDTAARYSLTRIKTLIPASFSEEAFIQVSTSMICPRVLLDPIRDVAFIHKKMIKVKETGLLVFSQGFRPTDEGVLVCIDRYITRSQSARRNNRSRMSEADKMKIDIKIVVPICATGSLVLIVFIRCIYRVFKRQTE